MTILPTLAPTISPSGISAPNYDAIIGSLTAQVQAIYGSDTYLAPDSADGQLIAIFAQAQNDANSTIIAGYNAYSPTYAQGAGLSSVVKINGLQRDVATNSTVDLTLVGVAGTVILSGLVADSFGNQWALPASVTIPGGGSIVETATCTVAGATAAAPGTVISIVNPQRGWQSATNASSVTPGAPVEDDAELRQRQSESTAIAALTPLESIVATVRNLSGVQVVQPYENDTGTTDGNGIPGHSICLVVAGGDAVAIATAIANTKIPGGGTYGSTSEVIIDQNGVPNTIKFNRPTTPRVIASINVTPLSGYVSTTSLAIQTAMSAWVAGLSIGDAAGVALNDLMAAAKLPSPLGNTYKIEYGDLEIAFHGNALGTADLALIFTDQPGLAIADITLVVL